MKQFVYKQVSSDSFENVIYKLFVYQSYIYIYIYIYNPQGLLCHKTTNQPNSILEKKSAFTRFVIFLNPYIECLICISQKSQDGCFKFVLFLSLSFSHNVSTLYIFPPRDEVAPNWEWDWFVYQLSIFRK